MVQLYREWAENRAESDEEFGSYIAKAEETINEGLKKVRVREPLWVESSKVHALLGDDPKRIEVLERAVEENPESIIPRFMLGRIYRRMNKPTEAAAILRPIVEKHHEEFRSVVEYALSSVELGKSYREAIALLRISDLYGKNDPRYMAVLGGMLFYGWAV